MKDMRKLLLIVTVLALMLSVAAPVLAHVHPPVPADECSAVGGSLAGNTASPENNENGKPPLPGLILNNTPSAVDGGAEGPGVDNAKDNCG